jgi:hypothetical protein
MVPEARWASTPEAELLPIVFTYTEARQLDISRRRLDRLRDAGLIERIGRGLYRRVDASSPADPDLVEIARRASSATLCLTTALARHGLTDEIPATIDVALPRGRRHPAVAAPVTWHTFDATTFSLGRTELLLDPETSIGLYGPERSIIDAARLSHREGPELARGALKRWLRRRGSSPAELLTLATHFPQALPMLRNALEILL